MSLLILEDEKNLGLTLKERLEIEGYKTILTQTVREAKSALEQEPIKLALLDVSLPDGSGFDVAKFIQEKGIKTPVIFLTAFGTPQDRVNGLELGAQDYIVKPFHLRELILRIKNVFNRFETAATTLPDTLQVGRAVIDFSKFQAQVGSQLFHLTQKECSLLRLLVEKKEKVISRDEIISTLWSENEFPTTRTVDNFILKLRKIIENNLETPSHIKSIRGVGYMLTEL